MEIYRAICYLLHRMSRMDMDRNLKKLGQSCQVLPDCKNREKIAFSAP